MYEAKFSEIAEVRTEKTVKLRKGRVALIVAFVVFLVLDVFLITEYKARGVNAVGYQLMERVSHAFEAGTDLVTSIWEPELPQDNNYTSVLVVGIDTRDLEFTGEEFIDKDPKPEFGTRNTDTIMQIIYDHTTGDLTMISIPRDMGVDVEKDCLEFHGSIHWVYDKGQAANCPGGGVQTLTEVVEGITGIKVHYYAFISLDAFVDIIDAVGDINENGERGVWVDNPSDVWELYPQGDTGWESVYFPKGRIFLTSEDTLKYARSRQISSDFARARRQQIVIEAIKDRVMSSDTLLNPKKLYSLIQAFRKNALFSEPNIEEIRAALNIARDLDESEIANIVLDVNFGGREVYINKQPHDRLTAQYYMIPTHWKECPGDEFCRVREFIHKILKDPELYQEEAKVVVYARSYGSSGNPNLNNSTYQAFKNSDLPISITESKYVANIASNNEILIFDFSEGSKVKTLDVLSNQLRVSPTSGNEAAYVRINEEDIAIVVSGN